MELTRSRILRRVMTAVLTLTTVSACGIVKVVKPPPERVFRSSSTNLGFEEGPEGPGLPAGYWGESESYEFGVDKKIKRSGKYSAYIEFKSSPENDPGWGAFNQDYQGAVFAGKTVRIKGWVKTDGAEACLACAPGQDEVSLPEEKRMGAQFRLLAYGPSDNVTETLLTTLVGGTSDWTVFEAQTAAPADTEQFTLALILWGKGKAWFDDLTLTFE